jgi:hypothetical protein
MLGDLPVDFLRIELLESQIYDPFLSQQESSPNANFLGHLNLTIAEVISYFYLITKFIFLFFRLN